MTSNFTDRFLTSFADSFSEDGVPKSGAGAERHRRWRAALPSPSATSKQPLLCTTPTTRPGLRSEAPPEAHKAVLWGSGRLTMIHFIGLLLLERCWSSAIHGTHSEDDILGPVMRRESRSEEAVTSTVKALDPLNPDSYTLPYRDSVVVHIPAKTTESTTTTSSTTIGTRGTMATSTQIDIQKLAEEAEEAAEAASQAADEAKWRARLSTASTDEATEAALGTAAPQTAAPETAETAEPETTQYSRSSDALSTQNAQTKGHSSGTSSTSTTSSWVTYVTDVPSKADATAQMESAYAAAAQSIKKKYEASQIPFSSNRTIKVVKEMNLTGRPMRVRVITGPHGDIAPTEAPEDEEVVSTTEPRSELDKMEEMLDEVVLKEWCSVEGSPKELVSR
eukprot:Skav201366  [mRNA]  locus=scaffold176:140452:171193:- [translate_table: standard]